MKIFILVICASVYLHNEADCAMTEAQMKSTLKLARNVCQPKFKATNEQIEAMHKGDWNQDKNGQCYMWCVLNMYKLVTKENEFDWEGAITTLQNLAPPSVRDPGIVSVKNCKESIKTKTDKCAAGYEIARCMYEDDPEHYFLP